MPSQFMVLAVSIHHLVKMPADSTDIEQQAILNRGVV